MRKERLDAIVNSYTVPKNQRLIYRVSEKFLYSSFLKEKFIQLDKDDDTIKFLDSCYEEQSLIKDVAATILRSFMSLTDANGYTGRGKMFVFSWAQLEKIIPSLSDMKGGSLLDIGAGDGNITARVAPHFSKVVTTEFSEVMQKQLRDRGWESFAPDTLPVNDMKQTYDLIMCLNVLDRADKPITLLREIRSMLKAKTGILLLAVVLPWCPFVESGNKQLPPTEKLDMKNATCSAGATWESSFERIVESNILPVGYELISWSKLPYISQGDMNSPYYTLSDAILVLRAKE